MWLCGTDFWFPASINAVAWLHFSKQEMRSWFTISVGNAHLKKYKIIVTKYLIKKMMDLVIELLFNKSN